MKKKIAVLLAGNKKIDFMLANTLIGLKKHNDELIDRIFIYYDYDEETRAKLELINPLKITHIAYSYENFCEDFFKATGLKPDKLPIANDTRFTHLIYAKFHCFDYLNDYDFVLWLDSDILVQGSFEGDLPFNCDIKFQKGQQRQITNYLKKAFNALSVEPKYLAKPNGGVIFLNSSILQKSSENLSKECFKIVAKCYELDILKEVAMSDELPFGVLLYELGLDFKVLEFANVFPYDLRNSHQTSIIHAVSASKFFSSSFASLLFREWFVNHKEWCELSKTEKKFDIKANNLNLKSIGGVYDFLLQCSYNKPLYEKIGEELAESSLYAKIDLSKDIKIYAKTLPETFFYTFEYKHSYGEWDLNCSLKLVYEKQELRPANEKAKALFEKILKINKDFTLGENSKAIFIFKKINIKNPASCLQDFRTLHKTSLIMLENFFSKHKVLYFSYHSARARIKEHLHYKFGKILLENTLLKAFYELFRAYFAHQKEQKDKQKYVDFLQIPALETCADYKEALQIKQSDEYELGTSFCTMLRRGGALNFMKKWRKLKKEKK